MFIHEHRALTVRLMPNKHKEETQDLSLQWEVVGRRPTSTNQGRSPHCEPDHAGVLMPSCLITECENLS